MAFSTKFSALNGILHPHVMELSARMERNSPHEKEFSAWKGILRMERNSPHGREFSSWKGIAGNSGQLRKWTTSDDPFRVNGQRSYAIQLHSPVM
jgi:hypothetical protein